MDAYIRLLHVENDPDYVEMFQFQMTHQAHKYGDMPIRFDVAGTIAEAKERLDHHVYDCVLCDYQLPDGNGLDLLRFFRARHTFRPFIMLTGQGDEDIARETFKSGANDYFPKDSEFASYDRIYNSVLTQIRYFEEGCMRADVESRLREEKKWTRTYFSLADVIVIAFDADGRLTHINRAGQHVLGYSIDELVGKSFVGRVQPNHVREGVRAVFERLRNSGPDTVITSENDVVTKDGTVRTIMWRNSTIRTDDGTVVGYICSGIDITDRIETLRKLQEKEQWFETFLNELPHPAFIKGADLRYLFVNEAYCAFIGRQREDILGKTAEELLSDPLACQCVESDRQALMHGKSGPRTRIAGDRVYEAHKFLLKQADGNDVIGGFLRNITKDRANEVIYAKLEAGLDSLPHAVVITDEKGAISFANRAFSELMGVPHGRDMCSKDICELWDDPGEAHDAISCACGDGLWSGDAYLRRFDGEAASFNVVLSRLHVVQDTVDGLCMTVEARSSRSVPEAYLSDTLERSRKRENEVSSLLEAAHAVMDFERHRDFERTAHAIFDHARELIGATAGYIALLTEDGTNNEVLFLESGNTECTVDPTLPMPIRGFRGEVYRTGKAMYDNEFSHSAWTSLLPEGHSPLENVLFAPLSIEGAIVGLMGLSNKEGGFTDNDARLAATFADLIAVALANSRALEKLERSEHRFRTLFDAANDALFIHDLNGTFLEANETARRRLGYSLEEFLAMTPSDIDAPEYKAQLGEKIEELLDRGSMFFETEHVTKDGHRIPTELSSRLIEFDGRHAILSIARDITERKQMEQRLQREKRFLDSVIETANSLIIGLDAKGKIFLFNKKCEEMLGISRDDVIGHNWVEEFIPPSFRDELYTIMNKTFQDGHTVYSNPVLTPKGERLILWNNVLREGESGQLIVAIGLDVTEERLAKEQAEKLIETLRIVNKILRHDISNDLSIINGTIDLYMKTGDSEALERAMRSTTRSIDLIKRMKGFETYLSSGDLTPVSLGETIRDVASSYGDIDVRTEGDCIVYADDSLPSVMDNLISNAHVHGGADRVDITIQPRDTWCDIRVADNGAGIPADIRDKVFEEEFSYGPHRHTGLGLFIASEVIKRYGGAISVHDNDPGAVFVITLRRAVPASEDT
ncbi:MAG TPA: PAS domain S-box protein [Methanomicrobia archaeon]|nr:PAS domain S-box protein [Methanomicrobia archaeon]